MVLVLIRCTTVSILWSNLTDCILEEDIKLHIAPQKATNEALYLLTMVEQSFRLKLSLLAQASGKMALSQATVGDKEFVNRLG
jgi:hypothetical protein